MIGLDTNVLLRLLTGDDTAQSPVAARLAAETESSGGQLFVNPVVLCELAWSLRGGAYRYDRETIADAIEAILATRVFVIQQRSAVHRALVEFRAGGADFADYLIGQLNHEGGCTETSTFDTALRQTEGFSILS